MNRVERLKSAAAAQKAACIPHCSPIHPPVSGPNTMPVLNVAVVSASASHDRATDRAAVT